MNETIKTQLNHRSIRQFKPLALTQEEVDLLVDVARHTATSNFRQSYSIISITDQKLKEEIADIANQPYIPNAGHLFVLYQKSFKITNLRNRADHILSKS